MKKFFGIGRRKEDKDARQPPQPAPAPAAPAPKAPELTKDDAAYWRARLEGYTELKAEGQAIGDSGVRALAEALRSNSTLTTLWLDNNSIGDEGARALAAVLKGNLALAGLSLSSNSFGDEGARALLSSLELNPSLTRLDLANNGISDALLEEIKKVVSDPRRKERALQNRMCPTCKMWPKLMGFDYCSRSCAKLGQQGHARAAPAPTKDDAPYWRARLAGKTTFEPEGEAIGDSGVRALADALRGNSTLKTLDLDENSIGVAGARAIAETLKWNSVLATLLLKNNSIGDEGARALLSSLELNPSLTRLDLANNGISDALLEEIKKAVSDPGRKGRALQNRMCPTCKMMPKLMGFDYCSRPCAKVAMQGHGIQKAVEDPGRKDRVLLMQNDLEIERNGVSERARGGERAREADRARETEHLREAELAREAERRRIEAEQQAARQRQREAAEDEARRKQEQLEDEARARQAREREAELARRLEQVKLREEEAERKIAEAQEMAKQARGDSGYDPAITPRPADPASPAGERGSTRSSHEISPAHLEQGRFLGAGGFGTVIEGTYQKHTRVALKMIHGSNLRGRQLEKAIAELEREMDVWSRLPYHVNVLPLMGWCRDPLCLVTLLMPGGTAKNYLGSLQPKPWDPRAVHRLLFQVALGMNHLHSLPTPILHLDLKGDNVLVDENGVAKISDFGMSKIRATASLHSTKRSGGTPVFMAPETFARPRPKPGTATDVYAFAMTMWELLSEGDIPLGDELMDEDLMVPGHGVDMEAFGARLRTDPSFRPERPRGLPDATWGLMTRCWALDAGERPGFGEVADELKRILDGP
ncbi:kinase-like domain-containing protein [Hyaloraphidium curvatum]|nr:kinase-like domain-containing protein [Hyaloraphidium curvatum]